MNGQAAPDGSGSGGIEFVGVVGAGVMGRGIAQVAIEAGATVHLADARPEAVQAAAAFIRGMLDRKVGKGQLSREGAEAVLGRLQLASAPAGAGLAALSECDLVIEAVAEQLDVKQGLVAALEAVVRPDCIIATNTSSLSVTGIAARAARSGRIAGLHFFNPVPLMRLVEIVAGAMTEGWVVERLTAFSRRLGHRPVQASDTPGFLVNHAGRAFGTEALRIVSEGVCDVVDVDRVMRDAAGFRMGPFELMDLVGLDVGQTVMESIYRQYYEEPRYRPVYLAARQKAAGLYGRKSGRGFYSYDEAGRPAVAPEPAAPAVRGGQVWVEDGQPVVRDVVTGAGARLADRPGDAALCLVAPLGHDATTSAVRHGLDPARVVAVDPLLDLTGRRTLMTTPATERSALDAARAIFAADGTPVTAIRDSAGFIAQRMLAMIVNTACEIAQQRIAVPDDIDAGVSLGLGYPLGSLAYGDRIGPRRILAILEAMVEIYGDPRYRPSPWLRRRALLGLPLATPEGT